MELSFKAQGDAALLAYLGYEIDVKVNTRVRALAHRLMDNPIPGVLEVAGSYACLQINLDPTVCGHGRLKDWVRAEYDSLPDDLEDRGRLVEIPVVYGGEAGPDLDAVARAAGMTSQEVIQRHSSRDYPCYVVGFTPGFPYLGGGDPAISLPRLESPRMNVPVGSVAIAFTQTGIYSLGGPGGWHLLGRTPELIYDPGREPPNLISAGDRVRFVPIDEAKFSELPTSDPSQGWQGEEVFKVKHPGAFTTVQDKGRWGYQNIGVPLSGALDQYSLAAANYLLGNPQGAAALEMTILGPKLEALTGSTIAVCGADLAFMINNKPAPQNQALPVSAGDQISFGGPRGGARAILAVRGGFGAPRFMGSRSVYALGRAGGPLRPGMRLSALPPEGGACRVPLAGNLAPQGVRDLTLRVILGPNEEHFSSRGIETFFGSEYTITQEADRRGIRLEGPRLDFNPDLPNSILSEPQTPGVVQVPNGGLPIILLKEQSMGGYAKIACVISADIDRLARVMPGGKLRFERVSLQEAALAAKERQKRVDRLFGKV